MKKLVSIMDKCNDYSKCYATVFGSAPYAYPTTRDDAVCIVVREHSHHGFDNWSWRPVSGFCSDTSIVRKIGEPLNPCSKENTSPFRDLWRAIQFAQDQDLDVWSFDKGTEMLEWCLEQSKLLDIKLAKLNLKKLAEA